MKDLPGNICRAAKIGFFFSGILGFATSSYGITGAVSTEKFELVITEKTFGGNEILSGNPTAAIEKMLANRSLSSKYNLNTNLCAAYTAQGKYSSAEKHCNLALRFSKSAQYGMSGRSRTYMAKRDSYAIALNNLGVMHALQGNTLDALEYFESASIRSKRLSATADRNIVALEQREANPVIAAS